MVQSTICRLGILLCGLVLLGGCSSESNFAQLNSTQAVLTSNNYTVVQTGLRGTDNGFRVFGIGSYAQYGTALEKIRVLAELDNRPRALINITEDYNYYNIGIVAGGTRIVTADVIEFTGPPNGN